MSDADAKIAEKMKKAIWNMEYAGWDEEADASRAAIALIERLSAKVERLTDELKGFRRSEVVDELAVRLAELKVKKLKAKVERLTLRWTSEKPAVPGLYAHRLKEDQTVDAGVFTEEDIACSKSPPHSGWYAMREFAGPFIVQDAALSSCTGEQT